MESASAILPPEVSTAPGYIEQYWPGGNILFGIQFGQRYAFINKVTPLIPKVYWIDAPLAGRLAIVPRPRAGDWLDDEIAGWQAEGIDVVVSLLESEEVVELGLCDEAGLCSAYSTEFASYPIPDRGVPSSWRTALALARKLASRLTQGKTVAIHCRAGIGRSSVIAACGLVCLGTNPDRAFDLIAKARGIEVPDTEEQRAWVEAFASWLRSAPGERTE
jgi:protein-tyrosine phosphatase